MKQEKGKGMNKLYRYMAGRKIAGVCAGLGEYADIDPLFSDLAAFLPDFTARVVAAKAKR